jgi:DNA polymerase III subunit gamma/tau
VSYQVLARKWRPRNFSELVGQEHVARPLINALDHNRLHHAFLFTGTRGVGKTTIARVLAKSLNCETGMTSTPCGKCSACVEVDEGRFVDLIEVDAASRTKVDDTRELLDNVQYAPTRGRYKVYLIDEVHMLSGHSFNALLKTLEEPPPHVKFLLATTDPQKLPVTVLSRCLQFNLKRLSAEQIADQLKKILGAEKIAYDDPSLTLLARAADGSLRDGLSLLDQAIAFGGGKLSENDVRSMLGTIDQDTVDRCLSALAGADAKTLLAAVSGALEHGTDLEALLEEILRTLHEVAIAQADASLAADERIGAHARAFTPEDVQLYYQIGVIGRRDLPYAPDPRSGVEMTLLRMLAFRPADGVVTAPTKTSAVAAPVAKPVATTTPAAKTVAAVPAPIAPPSVATAPTGQTAAAVPTPAVSASAKSAPSAIANWNETAAQLKVSGFIRELASNTALESYENGALALVLDETCTGLLNKDREVQLRQALEEHFGSPVRLSIRVGKASGETLAKERSRMQDEKQQAAVQAIQNDPNVRAMQERFGARVNPSSIRPKV